MNFVNYIRDNGLLNTDFSLVNGRSVRIVSIDYDTICNRPILGYDVDTMTTMTWNRDGVHFTNAGLNLTPPTRTVWIVTYPDDHPETCLDKTTAIEIARFNNAEGLGPSEVHEVIISNETKVLV